MTGRRGLRVVDGVGRDHGSIAVVTVMAILLALCACGAALVAVTDLSVTAARARGAADAAALAGAGVSPLVTLDPTGDPDAAAREVTVANGGIFLRGDVRGWPLRYGATVAVLPRTGWVRRLVGPVRETAVGAVRPRVPE